jgi:hypothetical protein
MNPYEAAKHYIASAKLNLEGALTLINEQSPMSASSDIQKAVSDLFEAAIALGQASESNR